ncbi:MAG: molybdopterin-synthase adenylyltransferase MoeB [Alcaligenaceae bacterium]|jgi:molybdopterin/thiamine biosynthesis adenylyltransferase|nr:molybdopterin-synthase adenylyltransferase MoeB [Alcaligenaceae bacterium]
MNDDQLLRYARHIMLDDFGFEGQERLLNSKILMVGAGGLGAPALMYLVAAGVGTIHLVDDDEVELSNLQRQIAHTSDRIGMPKVESAKLMARALNPDVNFVAHYQRYDDEALDELIQQVDLVLECTDNFNTRQQLNRLCFKHKIPMVSAAAIRFDGQLTVFDFRQQNSPCYACQYDPSENLQPDNCATLGVLSTVVGSIGMMQAHEALKLLLGIAKPLVGRLLMFDGRNTHWHEFKLTKNPQCSVCSVESEL